MTFRGAGAVAILFLMLLTSCTPERDEVSGAYTNITVEQLAALLQEKDFLLINTHTPYEGEIAGTDGFWAFDDLPYDRLPADKGVDIVVYCRSGRMSAIAAQTLADAGYTRVMNVENGMNAWQRSGREILNASPDI